jgi:hypothetical protein
VNFAIIIICLMSAPLVTAQAVRVPGTSVSLAPPAGFVSSARFPGFERADAQASIMVTEIPGPFAGLTAGMTRSGLASRGMTLLSSTAPVFPGQRALLLHVSQSAGGTDFLKWMLVLGDAKASVMVVGTFAKTAEAELSEAIRAAVMSTRTSAASPPDHFEGLPFRVSGTPALKIAGRMSNMLLLTESGSMKAQGPDGALLAIGSSVAPVDISDLPSFAEARAKQTKQLKGIRVLQQGPTTLDGSAAHELVAEGTDTATGRVVTLYQVIMPDGQGYVLMQGMVASGRAAVMIPEFRRVAASFRRHG